MQRYLYDGISIDVSLDVDEDEQHKLEIVEQTRQDFPPSNNSTLERCGTT